MNIPVSNAHGTDTSLENSEDRFAGLHEGLTDPVQTGSKAAKEARDGLRKYHRDKRQTGHNRQKKWCHGNQEIAIEPKHTYVLNLNPAWVPNTKLLWGRR